MKWRTMPDSERRIKTISLRLSEVEYEVLKTQYQTHGARSVSDLARVALRNAVTGSSSNHCGLAAKVVELDGRLQTIESELRRLRDHFLPETT